MEWPSGKIGFHEPLWGRVDGASEARDNAGMGSQGKKGKKQGNKEVQKNREEISNLQQRLKAAFEKRNGKGNGNGG